MTGETFANSGPGAWDGRYQTTPPWDIGRPQPALVAVASSGGLTGRVLDVGCGTGEHTLMAASLGLDATGVDVSPIAIRMAEDKAAARGVASVRFVAGDVLLPATLTALAGPYDTIIDCAVFHSVSDEDRPAYVDGLRSLLSAGGRFVMVVFSDEEPADWGPRRVSQAEIRTAFGGGWRIESIEPVMMDLVEFPQRQTECWLTIATAV
jgi:cyclopropane fatty-acyl-phospholipid synthase-like methyltransferase